MTKSRKKLEHVANFNKILDDLENIEVELEDKNKASLLLNVLLFVHFKDMLLFKEEQTITLKEVQTLI